MNPDLNSPITPIHTRVAGRVRLDVPGLYRSARVKNKLERCLDEVQGIRYAKANILSGRLLVVYQPGVLLDQIIRLVEQQLVATNKTAEQGASRRLSASRASTKPSGDKAGGLKALLRNFSMLRQPTPAFASTAVAIHDDSLGRKLQEITAWYHMDPDSVAAKWGTSATTGLSSDEAAIRLQTYGPNRLKAAERRSDLEIFIGQFLSAPVALLGASAVVAIITGGMVDAAVIAGVVLINSVIGFVTERQAEVTIASLSKTGVREVSVLRDGQPTSVPVETIIPGDILLLTPGDYVAADVRLLDSHRLSVDESALTGESLPVTKDHNLVAERDTALADRINMAYMGTNVTGGHGRGVVIATAETTELGQIQTMVGEAESPDTPMQKNLESMGTTLALVSGGVCAGVFGVGVLRGYAWLMMLKTSVSLAVAAVPEGLPAVATTTLAMGIGNMRKHNVSVRHLDAVETLGSVQVFCMDKTGTLTMNRMAVVEVYSGQTPLRVDHEGFRHEGENIAPLEMGELVKLMQIVTLCSEVEIGGTPAERKLEGSATEKALVNLAIEAGVDVEALRTERPTLHTTYRAEGRPYMTTLHPAGNGKYLLAVKGSAEEVLAMCTYQVKDGKRVRLSKQAREDIMAANERMAGNALRVLGAAYREQDKDSMPEKTEGLTWLGLAGMADPIRPGMDKLIASYHKAGIRTIMITGDQSATAYAIGQQLGLSGDQPLQVLETSKLEDMDPDLLAGLAKNVNVFARVSPAHKLKIVQALQADGFVVAMTGDGINDGPALKAADIGVAMGLTGTNVAREVSDVVLEDDNLHTMTVAIGQGRTIYNNIRKMIHFMVSTNLTEIEVMLAGVAFNIGEPMNSMQLLWINLVTDIFPGLALSMEPPEADIMSRDPRDPEDKIIGGKDLKRMLFESSTIGIGTMAAYLYGLKNYGPGAAAMTMAFNTLTYNELTHSFSSRSKYRNVFGGAKLPPNKPLLLAIGGMAALQIAVSLVPGARALLGTAPLNLRDLMVIGAGVVGPLIVNEATKPSPPAELTEGKAGLDVLAAPQEDQTIQEAIA